MWNRRSSEIQGTALGKCLSAWSCIYIYRSMPAGVAQSRYAFVGGTLVSTWGRWRIPVNKGRKGIRNADQTLSARGERADRIVGSPSWWSSINYNRSIPEDLKLSQIGSSPLPPPFRGLHSPGVRKYCQIIFACYFPKSSIYKPICESDEQLGLLYLRPVSYIQPPQNEPHLPNSLTPA